MNKKIAASLGSVALLGAMLLPVVVSAATLDLGLNGGQFNNIGLGKNDLKSTIAQFINVGLGFLGILAVLIILWGGFDWMTAGGDEKKLKNAKERIIQGIIGLIIILSAWAIASFVLTSIATSTGTLAQ